jgi:hypothetical protein
VTLKYSGRIVASSCTTVFNFSPPTGVLGGKNSKLIGNFANVFIGSAPREV